MKTFSNALIIATMAAAMCVAGAQIKGVFEFVVDTSTPGGET